MGGCLSSTQAELQQQSERSTDPIAPPTDDRFKTTIEDWLSEVNNNGLHLRDVPQRFQYFKSIVIAAVQQDGMELQHVLPKFKDDRDVAMMAVKQNGHALKFVSKDLRNDKELVTAAILQNAYALLFASPSLKDDKEVVMAAVLQQYEVSTFASYRLKNDTDILRQYWLKRVQSNGMDLELAPDFIRGNTIIALSAAQHSSEAVEFVTPELQAVLHWMPLVENNELDLRRAPENIRKDRRYVHETVQNIRGGQNIHEAVFEYWYNRMKRNGLHLEYAPDHMRKDMSLVLAAVQKHGRSLEYAPPLLQNNKTIVLAAVQQNPNAIKYAHGSMKRDPEVLTAAGMFDVNHDDAVARQQQYQYRNNAYEKIVLSTRFSLNPSSYSDATNFTKLLKANEYVRNKGFTFYAPNAFDKKTRDKNWTDFDWPCRGTKDTCQYNNILTDNGHPTDDCCWRYSFRSQLEEAKSTNGFMLQLIESTESVIESDVDAAMHGNGQKIERDMAQDLQMKIFRVYRPVDRFGREFHFKKRHIETVVAAIKRWYDGGCQDMSEIVVRPLLVEGIRPSKSESSKKDTAIQPIAAVDHAIIAATSIQPIAAVDRAVAASRIHQYQSVIGKRE